MARPVDKNSIYKVGIHNTHGHKYASTQVYTVGEDGKKKYRHVHWGTVDDSNKFWPGKEYMYAEVEERKRLTFPDGWDLSETEKLSGTRRRDAISYEADDVDRQYGSTWFLDRVAEATGLREDLEKVFGGNRELVDDILTMAYFPFVDNLSYSQLARWQREVKAPSERKLTSTVITRLTQAITEQNRMDLFKMRAARMGKDELCGVDSTSISSYGFNIADIRWGKNKECLPLRQTVEVVVYSLTSHMPIYYLELPGNMPDQRTMEMIMTQLNQAGFKNIILITDRGYDSMQNIERYVASGQKVITSVRVTQGDVLSIIRGLDLSKGYPEGMVADKTRNRYYRQYDRSLTVRASNGREVKADRMRINLYFDPVKRAEAVFSLRLEIEEQMSKAKAMSESGEPQGNADAIAKELNLLSLKFSDDGKLLEYAENEKATSRITLTAGFYANKTIGLDIDSLMAGDAYGMRDEQEKAFALQKGPLGQDRLRTSTESSRHGRMFICFVGLILASYVRSKMAESTEMTKKYGSAEEMLAEMRTIRCIEHTGRTKFITPFVGAQLDICKLFGFTPPKGCEPGYVSREVPPAKQGRRSKPKVEDQAGF